MMSACVSHMAAHVSPGFALVSVGYYEILMSKIKIHYFVNFGNLL